MKYTADVTAIELVLCLLCSELESFYGVVA